MKGRMNMKVVLNVLFHLLLISWHGYFSIMQVEDLIGGSLVGKALLFFLLRVAIVMFFSINLWKMTRKRETYS